MIKPRPFTQTAAHCRGQHWPLLVSVAHLWPTFHTTFFKSRYSPQLRLLRGLRVRGRHGYALVAQDRSYRERGDSSLAHPSSRRVSQIVEPEILYAYVLKRLFKCPLDAD